MKQLAFAMLFGATALGVMPSYAQEDIATLVPSDVENGDWFGFSVAIDGTTAVGGSRFADIRNPNDNEGAAYVFEKVSGSWIERMKLSLGQFAANGDEYGHAVAVSQNFVAVGAPQREVGGNTNAGTVYIYERNHGGTNNWGLAATLISDDVGASHQFGQAVAIQDQGSETILVVGEPLGDSVATETGAAYIFTNTGSVTDWDFDAKIISDDPTQGEEFGCAVALDGDLIIVGAEYTNPSGIGSVYIFHRDGDWDFEDSVTSGTTAGYGHSVAIQDVSGDDFAFVGWPLKTDEVTQDGVVHVLRRTGTDWAFEEELDSLTPESQGFFGESVSMRDQWAVIGSSGDKGTLNDDDTGAAFYYFYDCADDAWVFLNKFVPDNEQADAKFGFAVAITVDESSIVTSPRRGSDEGQANIFGPTCDADVTRDGQVTSTDLVKVVINWGSCGGCTGCFGDVDQSGVVDVTDLIAVILAWGACLEGSAPAEFYECVDRCSSPLDPNCVVDCAEFFDLID